MFYAIKVLGACYLLYLAIMVYRSKASIDIDGNVGKKSYWSLFRQGVFMNLVNPKVLIFFLAFFPAFIWDQSGNTIIQFYILGGTFMVVSFMVFSAIAIAAGRISPFLKNSKYINPVLKWLQILVFVGIAVYIILPDSL